MRRRDFIAIVAAAGAWPLAAPARQKKAMPVIGFLHSVASGINSGFREGLNDTGYVDGQNVMIEFRTAEGHYDRLPALAAEFVRSNVDVIATGGVVVTGGGD